MPKNVEIGPSITKESTLGGAVGECTILNSRFAPYLHLPRTFLN